MREYAKHKLLDLKDYAAIFAVHLPTLKAGCYMRPSSVRLSPSCVLFLAACLFDCLVCAADPGESREKPVPSDKAGALWKMLGQSRHQLQTGVFRAVGHESRQSQYGTSDGPVEIFCAFDLPQGRVRFDRVGPDMSDTATEAKQQSGQWFRTSKESATKIAGTSVVSVFSPTAPPAAYLGVFDVRALGLAYWSSMRNGRSFEEIYNAKTYSEIPPSIEEEVAPGLSLLSWRVAGNTTRKLWVNENEGYTPLRLDVISPDGRPESHKNPKFHCELTHKQVNGVWVPVSVIAESIETSPTALKMNRRVLRTELSLEWQSANAPVGERYFTIDGFDLQPGDDIVDFRLEHPTVVRTLPAVKLTPRQSASPARRLLIAVNVVFILLASFYGGWRWMRSTAA